LTFPEDALAGLGYAERNVNGTGVGPGLAKNIAITATKIVKAGVNDPRLFELVGLFQDNVGADRISDMVLAITRSCFLQFSERVAKRLSLNTRPYVCDEHTYNLPYSRKTNQALMLFPRDVLRDLPIALDWSQSDLVCKYNAELRSRVNGLIGGTWRQAIRTSKSQLVRTVLKYPDVINDLIKQYSERDRDAYDFQFDKKGEVQWLPSSMSYASKYPLSIQADKSNPSNYLADTVGQIIRQFRTLVENNGLGQMLLGRNEKMSQLMFFGIADAYCKANNLDVSPEVNSGRGPVDFKFSTGYDHRALVEIKLSSNGHIKHGYDIQLSEYAKAESTSLSTMVVVQVGPLSKQLRDVMEYSSRSRASGRRVPEIIVVDSRRKLAASKYFPTT
jgi:hypothetical protein